MEYMLTFHILNVYVDKTQPHQFKFTFKTQQLSWVVSFARGHHQLRSDTSPSEQSWIRNKTPAPPHSLTFYVCWNNAAKSKNNGAPQKKIVSEMKKKYNPPVDHQVSRPANVSLTGDFPIVQAGDPSWSAGHLRCLQYI